MSTSNILSIIGILATVLFGIWGLFIIIKKRYPGEISLIIDDVIGLFHTIVKNFPDLAVLYKSNPVSQGLVLFKGTILNSGNKDITPDMVEKEIALELPEGFKWLAAKQTKKSSNVTTSLSVDPSFIIFSTNLFRCQEYIKFEALAEVPIPEKSETIEATLINKLNPTHRIADTGKIRKVYLPPENYTKWRMRERIILPCFVIVFGIGLLSFALFKGLPSELHFLVPQKDGSTVEVNAEFMPNDKLHVESKDQKIKKTCDAFEFITTPNVLPKTVTDPHAIHFIWIASFLYFVIPLGWIGWMLNDHRKWKRLRRQIGLE